ncbi:MAG: DUF1385 domain-containing protein [Clostridia bacterium]|nr:DUF1385 domain-containing protein [Clostridia bacterium]
MANKKTSIGGQALMEGIMMRGPEVTAMAVRRADGRIVMEDFPTNTNVPKICKLPLIRGIYGMVTSFTVGYKCLMRSADLYADDLIAEEEAKEAAKVAPQEAAEPSAQDATEVVSDATETVCAADDAAPANDTAPVTEAAKEAPADKKDTPAKAKEEGGVFSTVVGVITMVIAVVLMLGLFFWLPTFLYDIFIAKLASGLTGFGARLLRSVCEATVRVVLLLLYMILVSQMKEIKRTFMYHGAEHKTIFCYEKGLPLTVENIRPMRRFHPRCGTSFLILMVLVGILLGMFIPFTGWLRVVCKIAVIPLTVGIGYELIKLAGRHDNLLTRIISAPGVWFQHITTKEPDDQMIECAIAAMEKVIPEDKEKDNW